jgi:PEP-CTERM motif-containing protein
MDTSMIRSGQASGVVLGAFACMLVWTALPREGMAQGSVYAVATSAYNPADNFFAPLSTGCGSIAPSQATVGYNCGPVPVSGGGIYNGSGYASAVAGQLRALTNGTLAQTGLGGVYSYAASKWSDQAFVTALGSGTSATELQIALHVTGTLSATGGDGTGQYGGSGVTANFRASSTNPYTIDPQFYTQWTNGPGNQSSPTYAPAVDQIFLLTLAVSNGSTAQFQYGLDMSSVMVDFGNDPSNAPFIGAVFSDFSHTVNPLWYHVLDADNADVTSAYNVTFAQGMTFGPEVSTTPEPSSLALLGTGMFGLVGLRGTRRKRSEVLAQHLP